MIALLDEGGASDAQRGEGGIRGWELRGAVGSRGRRLAQGVSDTACRMLTLSEALATGRGLAQPRTKSTWTPDLITVKV